MAVRKIFLIFAPLGVGKEELLEELAKHLKFWRIKEVTTLSPETKAEKEYRLLVSWKEFKELVEKEELFLSNSYEGQYFGVTKKELDCALNSGLPIIWSVAYKEADRIKEQFPEVFSILISSSLKDIQKRLIKRGLNIDASLGSALMKAKEEMDQAFYFADYILVNQENKKTKSVEEFLELINGKKNK